MQVTEKYYIQSSDTLLEKAKRIQKVINELEDKALTVAETSDIENYSFDDGQVSVTMKYKSPAAIARAIEAYERILYRTVNKLNGSNIALRPWQGLGRIR